MDKLSGEFFDLTITSLNNKFGEEKTEYSLRYGIALPISKYIKELQTILDGDRDGKTKKRTIRLNFLKKFRGNAFFEQYFKDMMCFINGGYHIPGAKNYHSENRLIITVAGGNIITIFARLVKDLLSFAKAGWKGNLSTFNYNYIKGRESKIEKGLTEFGGWSRWNDILSILRNHDNKEILLNSFSDFDYNLLPNRVHHPSDREKALRKLKKYSEQEKYSEGFVLLRVKTFIENPAVRKKPYTNKQGMDSCTYFKYYMNSYPGMVTPAIKYMAQLIDEYAVEEFKNNMDVLWNDRHSLQVKEAEFNSKYKTCTQFLDYLVAKKNSIAEETQFNVATTIKTFAEGYSRDVTVNSCTATYKALEGVKGASQHNEINAIMRYLHNVTEKLNTYILYWERGVLGINRGRFPTHDSLVNFKSLHSITGVNSKDYPSAGANCKLLYLGSYLIQVFLNQPELHSEQVLDTILEEQKAYGNTRAKMGPSKLTLVPTTTAFGDLDDQGKQSRTNLAKIKDFLSDEMNNGYGYPDGINITINSINTSTSSEPEKDIVEDLTDSFSAINLEDDVLEADLEPRPNTCRADMGSDSDNDSDSYYQWQYGVQHGWNNFDWIENELINNEYSKNPQGGVWLHIGNTGYDINFQSMTQTNNTNGRVRPIQYYVEGKASGIHNKHGRKSHHKTRRHNEVHFEIFHYARS